MDLHEIDNKINNEVILIIFYLCKVFYYIYDKRIICDICKIIWVGLLCTSIY